MLIKTQIKERECGCVASIDIGAIIHAKMDVCIVMQIIVQIL